MTTCVVPGSSSRAKCYSLYTPMDKDVLRKIARSNGGYATPSLNDKMYLHSQNFQTISGLEEFTGLKVIWLQSNALTSAKGLGHLEHLRVLYLHSNRITSLDGLETLVHLDTLNMSTNVLHNLKGISSLPNLTNLYLAKNYLRSKDDVQELSVCQKLVVLDVSDNRLEDAEVTEVFATLPELGVLYMSGNPVCSSIAFYRKRIISMLAGLTCLDGLPVEALEKRCAVAFISGGREAENLERMAYREEQKERERRDRAALRRTLAEGRARRMMREGTLPAEVLVNFEGSLTEVIIDGAKEAALKRSGVECSVCHDDLAAAQHVLELPCGHIYHQHCLLRWIAQSGSCPNCRMELKSKAGATPAGAEGALEAPRRAVGAQGEAGGAASREEGEGALGAAGAGATPMAGQERGQGGREALPGAAFGVGEEEEEEGQEGDGGGNEEVRGWRGEVVGERESELVAEVRRKAFDFEGAAAALGERDPWWRSVGGEQCRAAYIACVAKWQL